MLKLYMLSYKDEFHSEKWKECILSFYDEEALLLKEYIKRVYDFEFTDTDCAFLFDNYFQHSLAHQIQGTFYFNASVSVFDKIVKDLDMKRADVFPILGKLFGNVLDCKDYCDGLHKLYLVDN